MIRRSAGKGRVVEHRLTPAGTKMLIAGTAIAREVAERAFSALSKAELAQLGALLARVSETPDATEGQ